MWVSLQLRLSDASHCGGGSAGGASSPEAYVGWIRAVAAAIGTADAVVIVEPDTLALLCGDPVQRVRMLQDAVDALEANRGTRTYLDAGHSDWIAPQVMAERLRAAGVDEADGFALNVSNFQTTADNVAYGAAVSTVLGGGHFVVDTGRNGNGPGSDWCNPRVGRLGNARPRTPARPSSTPTSGSKLPASPRAPATAARQQEPSGRSTP